MFKFGVAALLSALAVAKDGKDFNGPEYLRLSAQDKSDKIWARVAESDVSGTWHFAQTLIIDQAPVFDTSGDELECGWTGCRVKTIHAQGNVAKIQWVDLGGHNYTGMFKGSDFGYVRMSVAGPVDTANNQMVPAMGVKLLRDGMDSANFVAMFSVNGQPSLNFLANDWSNHISTPTL